MQDEKTQNTLLKKNLLFGVIVLNLRNTDVSSRCLSLILFVLLFISQTFNAAALQEDNLGNDQEGIIHLSGGATIHGVSTISNVTIVNIPNPVAEKMMKCKPKYKTIEQQVVAKKAKQNRNLKMLQDQINLKARAFFYSDSHDTELASLKKFNFCNTAITSNLSSFNFSNAFISEEYILNIFKAVTAKQKFYTSLSYLQFSKLRDSFLRGPPQIS